MSPSRRRRGRGGKPSAQQLRDFWGEDVDDPVDDEPVRVITPGVDPTALVESLGPLPFPGAGLAPHYFQAVYERAAGLAVALAAAAGLLDLSGGAVSGGAVDRSGRYGARQMTEVLAPSFVGGLGISLWTEGDLALARAEIQPEYFKPGTDRIRLGVLATLVDMVAGSPAHAIINPTVDLRVTLLAPAPTQGAIELVCHPVKSGRLLFIGETLLHTGDPSRPFARSVCTFMNKPLDAERTAIFPVGQLGHDSYDDSLQIRETAPGVYEMDNHDVVRNGANGTVQGGAQALLAELTGERALDTASLERGSGARAPRRRPRDPLPQPRAHRSGAGHRRGAGRRVRRTVGAVGDPRAVGRWSDRVAHHAAVPRPVVARTTNAPSRAGSTTTARSPN